MGRKLAKYRAIFLTQIANSAAYPLDLLARSVTIVLFMVVFFALWRATFAAAGQTTIAGLTLRDTLWYLLVTEAILLSRPRVSATIAEQVKEGSIAYLLNRPYSFLGYQASVSLGDGLIRLVFNLFIGGAVVALLVGPPPALWSLPIVLVAALASWLIDFSISALIGLSAFVVEEVSAFDWIYSKLLLVLGGVLIPLDFFPDWLKQIAVATPFATMLYGPARLFVAPSWGAFGGLLLLQATWLALLGTITVLLYRRGMAWLNVNGG